MSKNLILINCLKIALSTTPTRIAYSLKDIMSDGGSFLKVPSQGCPSRRTMPADRR